MKNRFYLACLRDNVGDNVAFHATGHNGYVTDVSRAQVYTREEAQSAWDGGRYFDQPISTDHVDKKTVCKIDTQHIPFDGVVLDDA